ncbi:phosphotransferase [Bosea caraganae]|uniref:Phosphotransferase n=1 Tax=Bosea caraganae TaxID=2763117 RepID=A0A370LCI5_9HYPH|nr:aminoglycoside 3'-phosphotransferase/choline kinase family protein [Bosea caraganae]RDJ27679.1 phosphotransferase [Bosea caraganae]RDJ29692.1 phosphotransferase [Bosea caraganae]
MTALPPLISAEEFSTWRNEPAHWLPAALDIARAHRLPVSDLHAFRTGTNLVLGLGEQLILKIFPPPFRSQFLSERTTLRQLRGRLVIPTPEIVHEGEREQWSYLVMTRLDGVVGSEVWPILSESGKQKVLREIGETIAQVQRVPLGEIALIEPGWPDFMARQIAGCRERQIRLGLPEKYWDELDALIAAAPALIPMDRPAVILTGEYIPENFLLASDGDDWRLAGVFDFGDVLAGWGEYDLLGPSAFMTAGRPELVRSLLKGFGQPDGAIDPAMLQRLLTLTFLHRASDPLRKIAIEDWPHRAATLSDLGRMIWPIDRI